MKVKTSKAGGIARDSMSTFGTNLIGVVLALISSYVIANALEPDQKGLITLTQLVGSTLVTILSFSLNSAVIFFCSRFKLRNAAKAITKLSAWITAFLVIMGVLVIFVLRDSYFKNTPMIFLVLAITYAVFSFISSITLCILRGENKFTSYNIIILIQKALTTLFSLAIIFWKYPIIIILSNILIMIVVIIICFFVIRQVWKTQGDEPPLVDAEVGQKQVFWYGFKAHIPNVLSYINNQAGAYILNGFYNENTAPLGIYSFAYTLMEQLWLLPNAVSMVILSRIAGTENQEDRINMTVLSCKIVTYITFVCAVLVTIAATILIPYIFPKYTESIVPLQILVVGSYFITFAKVLSNSISAYGRPELNIISTICGVIANLALGFVLIPAMGINGAALSTSISLTVQGICSIIIFCKYTHTPVWRLILPTKNEISMVLHLIKRNGKS